MPLGELHKQVAAVALRAAAGHGFALGGSNALIAHGLIQRPTLAVDLFTDREHGVEAAADAVEMALTAAGFGVERRDKTAGLSDIFCGMGEDLAEWLITSPGGEQMALQMAYFDRCNQPVVMEFGPVLDLEDALAGKVAALASRSYERDYWDTSAALRRYTPEQLVGFARRLDPGLQAEDFADAGLRLDRMANEAFADLGLTDQDIVTLRGRFTQWPREAEARVSWKFRRPGARTRDVTLTASRLPASPPHPAGTIIASPTSRTASGADAAAQITHWRLRSARWRRLPKAPSGSRSRSPHRPPAAIRSSTLLICLLPVQPGPARRPGQAFTPRQSQ
jgi:Nucleotidyl transferase AbiEii toxin, Type IV TA system